MGMHDDDNKNSIILLSPQDFPNNFPVIALVICISYITEEGDSHIY